MAIMILIVLMIRLSYKNNLNVNSDELIFIQESVVLRILSKYNTYFYS